MDAQQTRRVLDRLVGYQISPLLWDKVRRGLSAGRVQTVALRLIVEREREIKAFVKEEYWTIDAHLQGQKPPAFDARFVGIGDEKTPIPNGEEAEKIKAALEKADWSVRSVEKRERRRSPAAPFTTSKFQQDASRKLRFSVKRAMMIAQRLYEGIDLGGEEGTVGLITYMRTDSPQVSNDALAEVREYIGKDFGKEFLPESPNTYKSKKAAQEAHEAIRPTSVARHPDQIKQFLQEDEYKVYKLIWQRFVASQMNPAVFDQTTVDIDAKNGDETYRFRVTGSVLKFEGFLKVYEESKDSKDEEDEALKHKLPLLVAGPEAHAEGPEAGAALHRAASALQRGVAGEGAGRARHRPAFDLLGHHQHHPGAAVRAEDRAASSSRPRSALSSPICWWRTSRTSSIRSTRRGWKKSSTRSRTAKRRWTDALKDFYKKFEKELHYAEKHMENVKRMEKPTDEKCERCGSPLVIKWGKHGSFYACSSYDKTDPNSCTFTKENPIDLPDLDSADVQETTQEEYCENCGRPMVLKRGRFGQFMACTGYPDCKTTRRLDQGKKVPDIPLDEKCPQCGRNLLLRHGRFGEFISCSGYPECKWVKQNYIGVKCPECKTGDLAEKKARRGNLFYGCSNYPKCKFTSAYKLVAEPCPECGSPYLLEKNLKSGSFLVCPNNKRTETADAEPKRRGKKKTEDESTVKCDYSRELKPEAVA